MTIEERNKWLIENDRFIYKVCQKHRFRRDYEDVVQTAFLGAIDALDRVDSSCDDKKIRQYVARYIDGYVMNYCIKKDCVVHIPRYLYDKGVRLDVLSLDYEYDDEETLESTYVPYIEPGYEEVEMLTDLKNCVAVMTDTLQRTALLLYEGYTRKDIAEQDHCSQNAIFQRVQHIKNACKSLYA